MKETNTVTEHTLVNRQPGINPGSRAIPSGCRIRHDKKTQNKPIFELSILFIPSKQKMKKQTHFQSPCRGL